jgi:nicotinamidase-related amidase
MWLGRGIPQVLHTDKVQSGANAHTALLVIDLQQALCDAAPPEPMQRVTARIKELLGWADTHSLPIVFVQHWTEPGTILDRGSAGWELASEVRDHPRLFHHEKNVLSSFEDGQLHAWLQAHDIRRLCVSGMQTEYCVSAACEAAAALGYEVILPSDAHMTIDGPEKTAAQIIDETNDRLRASALCVPVASLLESAAVS